MKVGIYCRVSTERQKDKESLPTQQKAGIKFCEDKGYEYEVFTEQVSGAKLGNERDVFINLERKLYTKEIEALWFWDWDRMIRDFVNVNYYFTSLIKEVDCKVFVLNREFDIFKSDSDRLEFGIRTVFADFERRKIANRLYVNKIEKWKRGEGFSGQVGFGYERYIDSNDTKLIRVKEEEAVIVNDIYNTFLRKDVTTYKQVLDRIWNKYNDGESIKGLSHTGRIHDILTYETFVSGTYTLEDREGIEWDFQFGSIIDNELYQRATKKRKYITSLRKTNQVYDYLLKGKVTCADCGSNMVIRGGGTYKHKGGRGQGKYGYYYCSTASKHHYDKFLSKKQIREVCISVDKSFNNINSSKLEEIVWSNLHKILVNSDYIKNEYRKKQNANKGLTEDNKGKLRFYNDKLQRLEKDKEKVFNDYATGIIESSDFNTWKKNTYHVEKLDLEEQINKLKRELKKITQADKIDDFLELMKIDLKNRFNNDRFNHRRAIIEQYVDKVVVNRKDIDNKKTYQIGIKVNFSESSKGIEEGFILEENETNTIFFTKNTKFEDQVSNKEIYYDFDIIVEVDFFGKNNNILYKNVRFDF
jgi:DNA invertase Pin-like site-specific DNA recombinase